MTSKQNCTPTWCWGLRLPWELLFSWEAFFPRLHEFLAHLEANIQKVLVSRLAPAGEPCPSFLQADEAPGSSRSRFLGSDQGAASLGTHTGIESKLLGTRMQLKEGSYLAQTEMLAVQNQLKNKKERCSVKCRKLWVLWAAHVMVFNFWNTASETCSGILPVLISRLVHRGVLQYPCQRHLLSPLLSMQSLNFDFFLTLFQSGKRFLLFDTKIRDGRRGGESWCSLVCR